MQKLILLDQIRISGSIPYGRNKNKIQNFGDVQNSEFSFFILAILIEICRIQFDMEFYSSPSSTLTKLT